MLKYNFHTFIRSLVHTNNWRVFLFIRNKKSNYKVASEPVAIENKVASDEVDQQNNPAGKPQAVQQNVYDHPAPSDSLTIENNNASSTSAMEQIEMQKVEQ